MVEFGIEFDGTDEQLRNGLKRLEREMPRIIRKINNRFGEEVIKIANREYLSAGPGWSETLHRRSGKLAWSIRKWEVGDSVFVGTTLIYAAIHEFGGTIYPVKGKYLIFKINGHWIFAKSVYIPKRPYIKPSIAQLFETNLHERIGQLTLQQEFDRIVGRAA